MYLIDGEHETSSEKNGPSESAEAVSENSVPVCDAFPDLAEQVREGADVLRNHTCNKLVRPVTKGKRRNIERMMIKGSDGQVFERIATRMKLGQYFSSTKRGQ